MLSIISIVKNSIPNTAVFSPDHLRVEVHGRHNHPVNAAAGAAGATGAAGVAGAAGTVAEVAAGAAGVAGALRVRDDNSGSRKTLPALFAAGQCRIQLPYRGAQRIKTQTKIVTATLF